MDDLYLCGSNIVTALGATTKMSATAVKAGISGYGASSFISAERQAITMAEVPDAALPPLTDAIARSAALSARNKRMVRLAAAALARLQEETSFPTATPLPWLLAGPHAQGKSAGINGHMLEALSHQTGIACDKTTSKIFATGRAGGFHAIAHAFNLLAATDFPFVLVGGVDTYKDPLLLNHLNTAGRLLFAGAADGFAPGEGAGFLLLAKSPGGAGRLRLTMPGDAQEEGHLYSDNPYLGDGLSQAFRIALTGSAGQNLRKIYASLNGEGYFAKELGVAITRNSPAFAADFSVEHPADSFGDIGAATAPALVALISQEQPGNYLAYASSDGPFRSAMCAQVMASGIQQPLRSNL